MAEEGQLWPEEDIITQLQGHITLMTSQFYNYAGYIQAAAPPTGPPLMSNGAQQPLSQEEFKEKFDQCVSEAMDTARAINQVIDGLPAPRNKEEILNDFEQLNQEADELDAKLRNEIIQSEQLLGSIRHSLRSVTKRKDD